MKDKRDFISGESSIEFQLPIFYLENKQTIEDHIVQDLELIENKETKKSLYDYVFSPTTLFGSDEYFYWIAHKTVSQ